MNYEAEIRPKKIDTPKPPTYSPLVTNVTRVFRAEAAFVHAPVCQIIVEGAINDGSKERRAT